MCASCWSNLEKFHKFYLAVNQAKDMYLAKSMNNVMPTFCEVISEPILCKDEPPELIEYDHADNNWQQNDIAIENFIPEATIDKRDFDAVFCEEFIPDCDAMMDDMVDATAAQANAEYSECQGSTTSACATRGQLTTKIKSGSIVSTADENNTRKRRAINYSERNLICEFCEEPFASSNEMKIHYEIEHNNAGSLYRKRVKR